MYSELREYFCTKLFCSRWFACSIPLNSSTIIQNRDLIPVVQMTIFLDKFTMSVTKRTKIGPQDSLTTPSISHKMSQSQLITKLSFNLRTSLPHNFTCHCKGFLYFVYVKWPDNFYIRLSKWDFKKKFILSPWPITPFCGLSKLRTKNLHSI